MRILICSDGTDPADNPTRLGGLIAGPCHSPTTLLGIAEDAGEEKPLREALRTKQRCSENRRCRRKSWSGQASRSAKS